MILTIVLAVAIFGVLFFLASWLSHGCEVCSELLLPALAFMWISYKLAELIVNHYSR